MPKPTVLGLTQLKRRKTAQNPTFSPSETQNTTIILFRACNIQMKRNICKAKKKNQEKYQTTKKLSCFAQKNGKEA